MTEKQRPSNPRSRIGVIADVCLIITCAITVIATTRTLLFQSASGPSRPNPVSGFYRIGDQLPAADLIKYGSSTQTLLMFLSSHCRYCEQSAPFYAELLKSTPRSRVLAIGQEPVSNLQMFLQQRGVEVDDVLRVDGALFRVPATPSLVLADSNGKVLRTWRGLLTEDQESEVRTLVVGPMALDKAGLAR